MTIAAGNAGWREFHDQGSVAVAVDFS